ncbi:MAG: YIP1 family protein [Bacteroidales bacterium]
MESKEFNFNAFIEDSKQALLNPREYFSTMSTEGGFGPPIIKAVIYGGIAGIFALLWGLFRVTATGGIFGGTIFGPALGLMAFISAIIGALIGLFIGALIIMLLVSIAGGKTEFEPIIHVTAALMVITPVSAFMNIFSIIHPFLGSLIILCLNLYMLWMLYNAMTLRLNASVDTSKTIMYVLGGILVFFFIVGLFTSRISRSTMRRMQNYEHSHHINSLPQKTFTDFHSIPQNIS